MTITYKGTNSQGDNLYTLKYPRYNGASLIHGTDRMSLISSMLETLADEQAYLEEEQAREEEQNANDLQDHKLGMI